MSSNIRYGANKLFKGLSLLLWREREVIHIKIMSAEDSEKAGLTTATSYGKIGWLGNFIVSEH